MKPIFTEILSSYPIISIIGLAKNTGKTTTLNKLINEAESFTHRIGLISTGRDGESLDVFTHARKPSILVPKGAYFTTTASALRNCEIKTELCTATPYSTSLGACLIAKSMEAGAVEVLGPTMVHQTCEIIRIMRRRYKLRSIFIDGSINRIAITTSRLNQGIILATGAAVGNLDEVLQQTRLRVTLMQLPAVDHSLKLRIVKNEPSGQVIIINSDNTLQYLQSPLLDNMDSLRRKTAIDIQALYTGGVISDNLIEKFLALGKPFKVICEDASKLMLSPQGYSGWTVFGGSFQVKNPTHLLALTVNPHNPMGACFEPHEFLHTMRKEFSLPVHDVMLV